MAGRSLMVAVALSAIALAASAGCAGTQNLMASAEAAQATPTPVTASVNAGPSGEALQMALATEAAAAGPTPVYPTLPYSEQSGPVRSFTPTTAGPEELPLTVSVGIADNHSYGPDAALIGIPGAAGEWRPMEVALAGPAASTGLDFQVAHRTGSDQDSYGAATTRGTEVRIGSGLREFKSPPSWKRPAWYVFAASDGQALIYTPASDPTSPNHAFHMQDRVNIGDVQVGVSAEAKGMQASLSYIRREVTTMDMIRHEETKNDDFAGFTFTWRK